MIRRIWQAWQRVWGERNHPSRIQSVSHGVPLFHHAKTSRKADNDNCFWTSLLGVGVNHFDIACDMRKRRSELLATPDLFAADRVKLIGSCDVYLALFEAICIERNTEKARAMAPHINQHIPELMIRCPDHHLRPSREQLAEVPWGYRAVEQD